MAMENIRTTEQKNLLHDDEIEIGELLGKLWGIVKRYFILLACFLLVGGIGGYLVSNYLVAPKYQSSATMIVNNNQNVTGTFSPSDYTASTNLVETYAVIIKSEAVLNPVIQALGINVSSSDLASQISVSSVNATQVMRISVTDTDKEFARSVTEKITEIAPEIIIEKVEAGSCNIVSQASDAVQVSPNVKKYTMIGILAGIAVAVIIIFLREILDRTIKSEEQLAALTNSLVIGVIPFEGSKN
ncbi:hypothetical protein H8Z77_01375 [Clostridium sp. NSJ-27]|uniref:Polysaccharide chain length determinant N-terminal domain-containing protein n=2 Tax=Clostridium facile TaxID=2763035 RepID=A0ABR7INK7_9CLOT|nr:hypothetical protein [Clostridium facile]